MAAKGGSTKGNREAMEEAVDLWRQRARMVLRFVRERECVDVRMNKHRPPATCVLARGRVMRWHA